MTLYIRDNKNNTIIDVECWIKTEDRGQKFIDISVVINIESYSELLLGNLGKKDDIIMAFSALQELRGWLWERYFIDGKNDPEKYDDVLAKLRTMLKTVADRLDLFYVED